MPNPLPPIPAKKSRRRKRSSGWQSQEREALDRKYSLLRNALIVLAVPTLIVIFLVGRYAFVERENAAIGRPRIINTRPPELLEPMACDLKAGFHPGSLRTYIRNVESGEPGAVLESVSLHIVPERKVGNPIFDEIPSGDCSAKPHGGIPAALPPGGRETETQLPEPKVLLPPLLNGEPGRIYAVSCVYYSDAARGTDHASCDTYRLKQPGGSPLFICDAMAKTGTFDETPVSSCGN